MYSCTKHFNIKTTYGIQRIVFISALLSIIIFLVSFELFTTIVTEKFSDQYFLLFLLGLLLLYPVHKGLHLLAFIGDTKSLVFQKITRRKRPPLINIRVNHPISKLHFCMTLLLPFVIITTAMLIAAFKLPLYAHYFLFLFSVNAGISFVDFIYLKYILRTPAGTYIEERKYGVELLYKYDV